MHYWDAFKRTLTVLKKTGNGSSGVEVEIYKAETLNEALDSLARDFEVKKALKMVSKFKAFHYSLGPLDYLLNQMFNKAKGAQIF